MTKMNRYDPDDPESWQAYVDGAMDAAARAEIEAAMTEDPLLRARIERAIRLRDRVRAGFDAVLEEPVPDRFAAVLASPASAPAPLRARRTSAPWWGLASAAALAAVAAGLGWRDATPSLLRAEGARTFASGALAAGLERQLASAPRPGDAVAIGLTFRDRDGRWCRSFAMPAEAIAGLACREDGRWRVGLLDARDGEDDADTWRQAASPMSPALVAEIDARIAGETLSADEERRIRDAGWR